MAEYADAAVADTIARQFAESSDFNGVPLVTLATLHALSADELREALSRLVAAGEAEVVFSRYVLNPYIKRMDAPRVDVQLDWLRSEPLAEGCAYPSPSAAASRVDPEQFAGRPYALRLARAEAQLHAVYFEPLVLERYRGDPRYIFQFDDYSGMLSIGDESYRSEDFPERDKVLLQTFGLGWRPDLSPVIAVFLTYLAGLTREHQAYWQSFEIPESVGCKLDPDYYTNAILGEWTEHASIVGALLEEQRVVNAMASAIGRPPLFRETYRENRPIELTPFLVPTTRNFDAFCLTLDKVLSDNISPAFFMGETPIEEETERPDGRIEVRPIGTIRQLEAWLRARFRPADADPIAAISNGFRAARKARQPAAHRILTDQYDPTLWDRYRQLLEDAYNGVRTLRLVLANHPAAASVDVPDWLFEGRIRNYAPPPRSAPNGPAAP